jgi:hypothetical protein
MGVPVGDFFTTHKISMVEWSDHFSPQFEVFIFKKAYHSESVVGSPREEFSEIASAGAWL